MYYRLYIELLNGILRIDVVVQCMGLLCIMYANNGDGWGGHAYLHNSTRAFATHTDARTRKLARTHTYTSDVTEGISQNMKSITPLDSYLYYYREEKNACAMYETIVACQHSKA